MDDELRAIEREYPNVFAAPPEVLFRWRRLALRAGLDVSIRVGDRVAVDPDVEPWHEHRAGRVISVGPFGGLEHLGAEVARILLPCEEKRCFMFEHLTVVEVVSPDFDPGKPENEKLLPLYILESRWKRKATEIVNCVLRRTKDRTEKEIQTALRAAYPFRVRENHPYKVWLRVVRMQRGLMQKSVVAAVADSEMPLFQGKDLSHGVE